VWDILAHAGAMLGLFLGRLGAILGPLEPYGGHAGTSLDKFRHAKAN
jgi:hypothetical protein